MQPLFVFVEGSDDERFFKKYFSTQQVKFIQYAHMKNKEICQYLRAIKGNSRYVFIADSDRKLPGEKAKKICEIYKECDIKNVYIVNLEIESWYMAGLSSHCSSKFKIKCLSDTNSFCKEQFNCLVPRKYSRIDFMLEVLRDFDFQEAKMRNNSFRFFSDNVPR